MDRRQLEQRSSSQSAFASACLTEAHLIALGSRQLFCDFVEECRLVVGKALIRPQKGGERNPTRREARSACCRSGLEDMTDGVAVVMRSAGDTALLWACLGTGVDEW